MKIGVIAIFLLAVLIALTGSVKVDWCSSQRYCPDGYRCCTDRIHCCPIGYVCCYGFTKCCRTVLAPFANSIKVVSDGNDMIGEDPESQEFPDSSLASYPKSLHRQLSTMSDEEKHEFMNRKLSKDPVIIIYNN